MHFFFLDSEILPSNKINDVLLAEDRPSVSQLSENIEYFTISELIVIYKNNGKLFVVNFYLSMFIFVTRHYDRGRVPENSETLSQVIFLA